MHYKEILNRLTKLGYEAYIVGGFVRDKLLGIESDDVDIATNAKAEDIEDIFSDCNLNSVGKQFQVIIVDGYEVATFRSETYEHRRKPDVLVANTFLEDSSRRDFTINSMALDIQGNLVDYFGGKKDLENRIIKAVGEPKMRFEEDPSRIIRAMYLASKLDFDIEKDTLDEMVQIRKLCAEIPIELMGKVVEKCIKKGVLHKFLDWLRKTNTLEYVFPEIAHTVGVKQNPKYHDSDVFGHTLRVVEAAQTLYAKEPILALAAVYHDLGKGKKEIRKTNSYGQPSDIGHEEYGAPLAYEAVKKLQFGEESAREVRFLVANHGLRFGEHPKKKTVLKKCRLLSKEFKKKSEFELSLNRLIEFIRCDAIGFEKDFSMTINKVNEIVGVLFKEVLTENIFFRQELPVNGKDLINLGVSGKEIGIILEELIRNNAKDRSSTIEYLEKKYSRSC